MNKQKAIAQKIGAQLKARRIELGMSQAQISEKTKKAVAYVSCVENGRNNIGIDTLEIFCEALDLEIKLDPKIVREK